MEESKQEQELGTEQDWPEDGRSAMSIMSLKGDTKVLWDKRNPDEVANARRTFDELKKKGYAAFRVNGKEGEKGEQMATFDPDAERMIMVPPMKGG